MTTHDHENGDTLEQCFGCRRLTTETYPPGEEDGIPCCGSFQCDLKCQQAIDYHDERGG